MSKPLEEYSREELIACIQDYQEAISEIESVCNEVCQGKHDGDGVTYEPFRQITQIILREIHKE
jgi:hypothetical protein